MSSVTLPVHAQTSPVECAGPPIVEIVSPASCSGTPIMGEGILGIRAFNESEQSLKAVNVTTDDPNSDLSDPSVSFPSILDANVGLLITWNGPAEDINRCFPSAAITMELEYCCEDGISLFETYNITQIFSDAAIS